MSVKIFSKSVTTHGLACLVTQPLKDVAWLKFHPKTLTHLLEDEVATLACGGKVGIDLSRVVRHRDDRLHQSQVLAFFRGQTNWNVLGSF